MASDITSRLSRVNSGRLESSSEKLSRKARRGQERDEEMQFSYSRLQFLASEILSSSFDYGISFDSFCSLCFQIGRVHV